MSGRASDFADEPGLPSSKLPDTAGAALTVTVVATRAVAEAKKIGSSAG